MSEMSPEARTAEAQKLRDEGDGRPVSQIEAEMDARGQAVPAGEPAEAAEPAEVPEDGDGQDS